MKVTGLLLLILLLCSCTNKVYLDPGDAPGFLKKEIEQILFSETGIKRSNDPKKASICIQLTTSGFISGQGQLISDPDNSDTSFLIYKQFYVPLRPIDDRRTSIDLSACLDGSVSVIPLNEFSAGNLAYTVDGLSVDEDGYALTVSCHVLLEQCESPSRRQKILYRRICELFEQNLPVPYEQPALVRICATGDFMAGRGVAQKLLKAGPAQVFTDLLPVIQAADFSVANLEGALSDRGKPEIKSYTFRFPPYIALYLQEAGFDAMLFANNHAYDWGQEAFEDTLMHLKVASLGVLGAGKTYEEAAAPFVKQTHALPIQAWGLASYPRENNGWDSSVAAATDTKPGILRAADISTQKLSSGFSKEALDVVFFHGNPEWSTEPDKAAGNLYRELALEGADIIFGSHPHVLQGFEFYQGVPMFWSLGNFVFPGMEDTPGGENGLMITAAFYGTCMLYMEPHALTLEGTKVRLADDKALDVFYERSAALRENTE